MGRSGLKKERVHIDQYFIRKVSIPHYVYCISAEAFINCGFIFQIFTEAIQLLFKSGDHVWQHLKFSR